ncbi:MAG TPA: AAA family ATPase [Bryobacteraceae bacterium]|nr:AAA family ATPase [Bryobacteraceae bacterium]
MNRHLPGFASHDLEAYPTRQEISEIVAAQSPSFCLLEVGEPLDRSLSLIPEFLRADAKLPILALLSKSDADLGLRCLRQGASDFLIHPFTSDQVEAALQKITRLQPGRFKNPGKVFCIMPAKGGCGASTLATNFAYQLKRSHDKRVLLADLDPLAGTQSFLLKIKSSYSFLDVLAHSQEVDADLWKQLVSNRQGLDILLAPETIQEGMADLTDPSGIIEYARGIYDTVVLDAGGVYGEWNLVQAQMADEVLLVSTNELTSLQAVQRALTYLESNEVRANKVRLIVNRYDRHTGMSRDVIGTALHTEIFHLMPADNDAIQKALMDGKPIAQSTNFGKSVGMLVDRLNGKAEPQRKSSSISGLLSLFSRTSS